MKNSGAKKYIFDILHENVPFMPFILHLPFSYYVGVPNGVSIDT
jgi:hypothetical protein